MTDACTTIAHHVKAIEARDLAAYSATLHPDVSLVLPNGTHLLGRGAVEQFHRDFFANPDWSQRLTEVHTKIGDHTTTALYEADYRDRDAAGTPIHKRFLVGLVFVRTGQDWLLLHDQCTPLPATE